MIEPSDFAGKTLITDEAVVRFPRLSDVLMSFPRATWALCDMPLARVRDSLPFDDPESMIEHLRRLQTKGSPAYSTDEEFVMSSCGRDGWFVGQVLAAVPVVAFPATDRPDGHLLVYDGLLRFAGAWRAQIPTISVLLMRKEMACSARQEPQWRRDPNVDDQFARRL